ncbi:MAG: translation initiation factor IF-5A [Candidatus Undinarchaeales archaeon]|jgi:translation initiation factor 5A|nr:translation initiation factor IF-5A [Candidatus Undinarchaeales archaeon]MDP7493262.1 translation initiation factor IF-5A [Candidatus Undinarchaeales archaeon]
MIEKAAINTLKKGKFILLDGEPCRVVSTQSSAPGKHGHAKVRMEAVGIFDGQKRAIVQPSHNKVSVPIVDKRIGQVLSVHEGRVQLMDNQSYETFEIPVPDDFDGTITEGGEVAYWDIMGRKLLRGK